MLSPAGPGSPEEVSRRRPALLGAARRRPGPAAQRLGLSTTTSRLPPPQGAQVGEGPVEDGPVVPGGEQDGVAGGEPRPHLPDGELEDPGVVAGPGGHVPG